MEKISINEALIDSRIIFLNGEIDEDLANYVIARLLYLDSLSHEDISIYINSPGGSVTNGLAIIDTMALIHSRVTTIAIGTAASMAAVILSCGDHRCCLEHTRIMIHQVSLGVEGRLTDVSIAYQNVIDTKNSLMKILSNSCHKTIEQVEKDCEKDYWFDAYKAKEYGLIDEILCNSKKIIDKERKD